MDLSYLILIGITVSIDGFFAGMAYEIKKITIPYASLLTIGLVNLFCTTIAICSSLYLGHFINPIFAASISALLLILLGTINLLKEYISDLTDKTSDKFKITIPIGCLVINIMKKPECADVDHSLILNTREAILLGFALGIDNMTAAFAIGLMTPSPCYVPITLSVIQISLVWFGIIFAGKIAKDTWQKRTAYIPGIVLILMGLLRIL